MLLQKLTRQLLQHGGRLRHYGEENSPHKHAAIKIRIAGSSLAHVFFVSIVDTEVKTMCSITVSMLKGVRLWK